MADGLSVYYMNNKTFFFCPEKSPDGVLRSEDDQVVLPNIPLYVRMKNILIFKFFEMPKCAKIRPLGENLKFFLLKFFPSS